MDLWLARAGLQIKESGFEDWCRVLGQDIGTLSKPRRQRKRERGKIKGLMSRTMVLHVHYTTCYVS